MAYNDGSTVGHAYSLGHPYFEDCWHKKGRKTCDLHPHIFYDSICGNITLLFSTPQVLLNSKYRQYFRMSDKQNVETC